MGKGLNGWVEIFKGGKQVDAAGNGHDGDALIDKAVATFNAAEHEPPAVVGHPKTDDPAYGWVAGVRKAVKCGAAYLEAKFRDVVPAFEEGVKDGRYKKRSAAFYKDGRLRHVGFLGAVPPAVKGLSNIEFADGDCINFEFNEENNMDKLQELQDKLDAEKKAREKAEGEAAAFKEKADHLSIEFAENESKRKRGEIAAYIDQGVKNGKILPSWVPMGLGAFMENLEGVTGKDDVLEFAEGEKKEQVNNGQWFRRFLSTFSEHPLFKEMAPPKEDKGAGAEFAEEDALGKEMAALVNPVTK